MNLLCTITTSNGVFLIQSLLLKTLSKIFSEKNVLIPHKESELTHPPTHPPPPQKNRYAIIPKIVYFIPLRPLLMLVTTCFSAKVGCCLKS